MNTDPVETRIVIDDRDVRIKFDEFERRIKKFEESGKRAGKGGSAFMSAAIGGAAGFVAGAAMNNPATSAISDLLINVLAAGLLPVMLAILPALKGLTDVISPFADKLSDAIKAIVGGLGPDKAAQLGLGAYIGGRIGGPGGAVVGAGVAAAMDIDNTVKKQVEIGQGASANYRDNHSTGIYFVTPGDLDWMTKKWTPGLLDKMNFWGPDIVG